MGSQASHQTTSVSKTPRFSLNVLLILDFILICNESAKDASMKSLLDTLHKHVDRPQMQWTVEHKDGFR